MSRHEKTPNINFDSSSNSSKSDNKNCQNLVSKSYHSSVNPEPYSPSYVDNQNSRQNSDFHILEVEPDLGRGYFFGFIRMTH